MLSTTLYDIILWLFSVVLDLFFREVHPRSTWRIPKKGPVLFVAAPHANQFVDPLILLRVIRSEARRRVSFLIAAKSMDRPVIALGARIVGAVPVARAMDSVKRMKGKIYMPDSSDDTLIRGHGTDFESKEYEHVGRIVLPKVKGVAAYSDISKIEGPEELRIKRPFRESFAKDMLTGRGSVVPDGVRAADLPADFEGVSFSITPKIDQSLVYDAVFDNLSSGGCVGIFPEGGSHDRTELLPLQAGVALMALGTLAKNPECGLTIMPCGMNYFHAHKFRSRCVVEFGPGLEVKPEYVEQYSNPAERSNAVKGLLAEIEEALRAVIVHAPDYETLMLIQAVRRLYKPEHKKLPLPYIVELNRRLIKGYTKYKENPMIISLKKDIIGYNQELMQLNIRDHQVSYARFTRFTAFRMLVFRVIHLAVLSIAVLPGLFMFAPVFITAKIISIKKSKEALAASSVKIAARDVIATWKILIALGLTPLLYCTYAFIAWYIATQNRLWGHLPRFMPAWTVFPLSSMFFAALSFLALRFGESAMDIVKSLRPLILALSPSHGYLLPKLRERRAALVTEVNRVINTLGPELFPDFETTRLIPEAAIDGRFDSRIEEDSEVYTETPELALSEPSTPGSPTFNRYFEHSRSESFANLGSIGVFSSRPATPRRARSRSNSSSGNAFGGLQGFSPIDAGASSDKLSKSIKGAMRQRNARRRSESERGSGMSSRSNSPDSMRAEFGGLLHMTKDTKEE